MSEHFLSLIPTTPEYVPVAEALARARELFAGFVPAADEIEARITDEIEFVDQGENFERVRCPNCAAELAMEWWQEAMDTAYQTRFQNLKVTTVCCGFTTSLNELDYHWPAGFARFCLRVRGPRQKEVAPEHIRKLEEVLSTPLRQIWTHY